LAFAELRGPFVGTVENSGSRNILVLSVNAVLVVSHACTCATASTVSRPSGCTVRLWLLHLVKTPITNSARPEFGIEAKKKKGVALIYATVAVPGVLYLWRGAKTKFQAGQLQSRRGGGKATSNARATSNEPAGRSSPRNVVAPSGDERGARSSGVKTVSKRGQERRETREASRRWLTSCRTLA
jgi:hypothetical protein